MMSEWDRAETKHLLSLQGGAMNGGEDFSFGMHQEIPTVADNGAQGQEAPDGATYCDIITTDKPSASSGDISTRRSPSPPIMA